MFKAYHETYTYEYIYMGQILAKWYHPKEDIIPEVFDHRPK